jgi:large subunit ribosomal protein L21
MYAVIETGGKQYRVEVGSEIEVEHLDVEPGQTLELTRVLLVADGDETAIGRPLVDSAHVSASVVRQDRGDKIVVFKYRPKARSRVKQGHRQELTVLRVADIVHGKRSARQLAEAAKTERERLEAAAAEEAAARAAADKALAEKLAQPRPADAAGAETAPSPATPATEKPAGRGRKAAAGAEKPKAGRPRAPRTQAPAPEGEAKPRTRGTRKDA